MVNFPRPLHAFTSRRFRFKAMAAGAALAFITGLSAPAAAAASGGSAVDSSSGLAVASVMSLADDASAADSGQPAAAGAGASVPSLTQMHPTGIQGSQTAIAPDTDQMNNAKAIIQAGQALGLPPRAWVIAIATSLQESQLRNLGDLGASNDHDSLGLFQQRPSSGWGSAEQIRDPNYAATQFYKGLVQVQGWDSASLTAAAQAVQVSAFPDHYAKWEAQAGDIVQAFYGQGPLASLANQVM